MSKPLIMVLVAVALVTGCRSDQRAAIDKVDPDSNAAVGVKGSESTATGGARRRIVIAQAAKTLLYLPLYVAVERGTLQRAGIDVEIRTAGGDDKAFAALASGEAQFAQGDPAFVAVAHERGGPGVVIGTVLDRVAFWAVTFDSTIRPLTSPSQFRGRTVVTFPRPSTAYVVQQRLVERGGLRLGRDTRIVQVAFGSELGPISGSNRQADIAASIEPTVSLAESQGARIVYSYASAWGPFLLTGLMTTEAIARSDSAMVARFVASYEDALQFIRSDPNGALTIAKKYFPEVSESVLSAAIRRLVAERVFPEHVAVDSASWRAALDLRVAVGDLRSADHHDLIDNRFATSASRVSSQVP